MKSRRAIPDEATTPTGIRPAGCDGREGRSVVRQNGGGQPKLTKGRIEDAPDLATVRNLDAFAADKERA